MTCNVAVVSEKGGVGKTTTVVNVTVVQARRSIALENLRGRGSPEHER